MIRETGKAVLEINEKKTKYMFVGEEDGIEDLCIRRTEGEEYVFERLWSFISTIKEKCDEPLILTTKHTSRSTKMSAYRV